MIRKEVQVRIPNDMDTSPVALLVQTANRFASSIYLEYEQTRVNAKIWKHFCPDDSDIGINSG